MTFIFDPGGSNISLPLAISDGGTGAIDDLNARINLNLAESGINSDITEIQGLTTPLSMVQGGTGSDTLFQVHQNLGIIHHPGITPNNYYLAGWQDNSNTTVALSANQLYAIPIYLPEMEITRIGMEVFTPTGSPSSIRLGIYDNGVNIPQNLLLDAGTIAGNTSGIQEIITSLNIVADWYWLAFVANGTPTVRAGALNTRVLFFGTTNPAQATPYAYQKAFSFSTLPSPVSTFASSNLTSVGNIPRIWVRNT